MDILHPECLLLYPMTISLLHTHTHTHTLHSVEWKDETEC